MLFNAFIFVLALLFSVVSHADNGVLSLND